MNMQCPSNVNEKETEMGPAVKPRIYLAGPDVFLREPLAMAKAKKAICQKYGYVLMSSTHKWVGL